jgi:hypothetical protein
MSYDFRLKLTPEVLSDWDDIDILIQYEAHTQELRDNNMRRPEDPEDLEQMQQTAAEHALLKEIVGTMSDQRINKAFTTEYLQ